MRAAIYEAIFSLGNTNSTLRLNCPTGNCTFSTADTLGFCSTCIDVTEDVTFSCHTGDLAEFKNGATNCTYHLPGNIGIGINSTVTDDDFGDAVSISSDYTKTTNMSIGTLPRYETLYSAAITANPSDDIVVEGGFKPTTTTFQGITDPLLAFGRVVFNNSFNPIPVIGGDPKPKATECALYWCVQTIDLAVNNGIISQNITQTWSNASAVDIGESYLSPPPSSNQSARDYFVSEMSNIPLVAFLENAFTANMTGVNLPGSGLSPDEMAQLIEWSSDVTQALWNVEDLEGLMSSLADRMTDTLRNQFSDPVNSPNGTVYVQQTYVHVSWPWMILPITLVSLSCVLLLASIIVSHGPRSVVWKNSSLAVLFHGLHANEQTGYLVGKKEMEVAAEEMSAQLKIDRHDNYHLMAAPQAHGAYQDTRSMSSSGFLGRRKWTPVHTVA